MIAQKQKVIGNKRVIDDCDEYVTLAMFCTINIFERNISPICLLWCMCSSGVQTIK